LIASAPTWRRTALVVFVATAIQTLGAVTATSLGVFGPILVDELELDAARYGLLVGSMNVGALPTLMAGASIVDRLGPGRSLALSGLASAAGLVVFAANVNFLVMLAALTVAGGGWGLSAISGSGAIIELAPFRQRGVLISIRQLSLPLGGILAGVLVPLVALWGWQLAFVAQAGAFLVFAALATQWARARAVPRPRASRRRPPRRAIQLGLLSIAMSSGQWAFLAYVTIEMTGRLGVPYETAVAIFVATQAIGAVARVVLGMVTDRLGPPRTKLLAVTSATSALCLLAFGLAGPDVPTPVIAALAVVTSVFVVGWNGVMIVEMAEAGPRREVNQNLAAGMTLARIGNIVAPPITGSLIVVIGSTGSWIVVAIVMTAASLGCLLIGGGPIGPGGRELSVSGGASGETAAGPTGAPDDQSKSSSPPSQQ
jgi:MFS family permease